LPREKEKPKECDILNTTNLQTRNPSGTTRRLSQ
jgi:hypothetical protein